MYKLLENGVLRIIDGASIPNNPSNRDWREFQQWLNDGNTPQPRFTEEELEQIRRSDAIKEQRDTIREEVRTTPPPQSLPGLSERVEKLEILMGIKEPEITV